MEYECDMRLSVVRPTTSERPNFERRSSSDSSSDEWSYTSSRNQRKCFWKGGDYSNAMKEALQASQSYSKRRIKPKKEAKAVCSFLRKKVRDIRHSFQNKHTTIKLTNVPVKKNNILDLYHCFYRFGTITLIQAQRNSDPYCAILSFLTTEDARSAMENARKIISNVRAVWFADICLLNTSEANYVYTDDIHFFENKNTCRSDDIIDLSDKLSCTQIFNAGDRNCSVSNYDMKYEQNLEILITELIRKKNKLLSHQMNSMREIIEKINKCEVGSKEEKILSELLKKVQDQVHENRKSIEYSIKQRTEYFAKRKDLSFPKNVEKPTSNCPPWISAFKAASAKRAESAAQVEGKRRKSNRAVSIFRATSVISDGESSSSNSEKAFADSSEESVSKYYSSNFCRNTIKRQRKLSAIADGVRGERYECEMDHLLSDISDV